MKNFLIAFAAGSILALATSGNRVNAQRPNNLASLEKKQGDPQIDKSVIPVERKRSNDNFTIINARAFKNFKKAYKNATDEKWDENKNDLTVKFTSNGINHIIYYNKKGNWKASLKGYAEDKLNTNIRAIVKQKYYDYKITYVQEIETDATAGTPTYMVHLEGNDDFKIIRVSNGEMDVYEEYGKQK